MSNVGLFIVGACVTLFVLAAAAIVVWGIVLDSKTRGRDAGIQ